VQLKNKVALVTGGGVGIGAAVARLFAREGASVVITGRRKDVLEQVVAEIERARGRALVVTGSVTDEAHVRSAVAQAVRTFGRLDILVNNAGIGSFGKPLHETDDATWEEQLAVNLTGVFRMTRAALPHMLQAGGGSIINISSIAALVGIPLLPAYGAAKGGLNALTRCLAIDYAAQNIRCNAICPGLIATPMAEPLMAEPDRLAAVLAAYPMARTGKPEEVAKLVLYLACDDSAWMTGSIIPLDGGMTAR
jgi:NAD(P)-dependent dehydrogenase (short-subunit alcohol dehydrogenase family)